MLQYMCKRLLRSLVTLLIIVVVIFSLLRLMPEEGYFDNYDKLTPSEIENKLTLMGLRDALPIKEETGASYAAEHDGFMHACGHDAHTAMLLGAAKVLQSNRAALKGEAVLIFQTAEETAKGAKNVIANGWLDGADAAFGIHIGTIISNTAPAGTIFAVPGCCMASIDRFTIRITGAGCHGSTPEKGTDPINAAAHIITALQAINSREFNACAPIVVTIGSIHGGSQYNIIPDCVEMEGTIRSVDSGVRMAVAQRIEQIAAAQAAVFGADAQCVIDWGAPPVINDESMARLAAEAAKEITRGRNAPLHALPRRTWAGRILRTILKNCRERIFS